MLFTQQALAATDLSAIGYTRLATELGPALPTGATIRIAQVEANTNKDFPFDPEALPWYLPPAGYPDFSGTSFHAMSQEGGVSPHASEVATYLFGDSQSIAPGVQDVDVYLAKDWQLGDYLRYLNPAVPERTEAQVFNHSWVGPADAEQLARVDYDVATNNVIHVAGVNNLNNGGRKAFLASAYNVISVGLASGRHETGSVRADDDPRLAIYAQANRVQPDLVVDEDFTSYATPIVAGAATILLEYAQSTPAISHGMAKLAPDDSIYSAATSEVIRAALFAGANKSFVPDYGAGEHHATNNLDKRYGAGMLDVYNSYHILAAGEQEATGFDGPSIGRRGFDYVDDFGASDASIYHLETGPYAESLSASLVWNAEITTPSDILWKNEFTQEYAEASLANFNMLLLEKTELGTVVAASSQGPVDNSENFWLTALAPNSQYDLVIGRDDNLGAWDYALAWRLDPLDAIPGDADLDGIVGLSDFAAMKANFGQRGGLAQGDFNGDGLVDLNDFAIIKSQFGSRVDFLEQQLTGASGVIPEPSSGVLAFGMVVLLGGAARTRRRR